MKTNKNISEETLHKAFSKFTFDEPSPDFMGKLLQRIEKEAILMEKRKQLWVSIGQVAAGIFGIILLPALTIYLCTLFLSGFTFSFPKIHLNLNLNLLTIGFAILLLLILDTLFRMHATKHMKQDL
jgi:hypothetical protein